MGGKTRVGGTTYNISPAKVLINGTAHNIKQGNTRIGTTTSVISFDTAKPGDNWTWDLSSYPDACGTTYVGRWKCPATGYYNIELHGGGGAGGIGYEGTTSDATYFQGGASGGGSGELFENQFIDRGATLEFYIGDGGHYIDFGNTHEGSKPVHKPIEPVDKSGHGINGCRSYITVDGNERWSIQGGNGGDNTVLFPPGSSSIRYIPGYGSLAENGVFAGSVGASGGGNSDSVHPKGGLGNKNKPSQTYGNGGYGGMPGCGTECHGSPGGCIITFVSK